MTFRTILALLRPKSDNAVPEPERHARRITPVAMPDDVRRYFAEVEQIKRELAIQAEIDAGQARAKRARLKHAAAAHLGHERKRGRA